MTRKSRNTASTSESEPAAEAGPSRLQREWITLGLVAATVLLQFLAFPPADLGVLILVAFVPLLLFVEMRGWGGCAAR